MVEYKPGDIANGYVWTGHSWVPVSQATISAPPPVSTGAPVPRDVSLAPSGAVATAMIVGWACLAVSVALAAGILLGPAARNLQASRNPVLQVGADFIVGLQLTAQISPLLWLIPLAGLAMVTWSTWTHGQAKRRHRAAEASTRSLE